MGREGRWSPICSSAAQDPGTRYRRGAASARPCRRSGDAGGASRSGLSVLEGWRFEQFGLDALDLVEGRLGFVFKGGKLKMVRDTEEVA